MGLVWNSIYACKNTIFLLYKQVKFVVFSLKKREKSPSPMQGLCNSLANPIFPPILRNVLEKGLVAKEKRRYIIGRNDVEIYILLLVVRKHYRVLSSCYSCTLLLLCAQKNRMSMQFIFKE